MNKPILIGQGQDSAGDAVAVGAAAGHHVPDDVDDLPF